MMYEEETKPEPTEGGPVPVFDLVLSQFKAVTKPTAVINNALSAGNNVIRPSVGFDLIYMTIKTQLEMGVPEFVDHKLAWEEALRIIGNLRDEVAGTGIDAQAAMVLDPMDWPAFDVFDLYGKIVARFNGQYLAKTKNWSSNTFGQLTPAECLECIYFTLIPFAPPSIWESGLWKAPNPDVRATWVTWPWADYVLSQIQTAYLKLAAEPTYPGGSGSNAWSGGRGW